MSDMGMRGIKLFKNSTVTTQLLAGIGSILILTSCTPKLLDYTGLSPTPTPTSSNVPTVTFSTPAASSYINNVTKSGFIVSGTCSVNGQMVSLGGAVSATSMCLGNAWTHTFDLSALTDGAVNLTANLSDASGNRAVQATRAFLKDTVVTAFGSLAVSPVSLGNNVHPVITGTTEGGANVKIYPAAACAGLSSGSATALGGGSFSVTLSTALSADAAFSLSVLSTDLAGNTRCSATIPYTLDTTPPVLTLTTPAIVNHANSVTFGGTCEGTLNIAVTGTSTGSVACASSAWTFTPAGQTSNGVYSYTFTETDAAGNATAVVGTWTRFVGTPVINSIAFTNGSSLFATPNVLINPSVTEAGGPGIALYQASDQSNFANTQWRAYGSGTSLGAAVSMTNGTRPLYVQVQDLAGNLSAVYSATNFTMAYGSAPVLSTFKVLNSTTPNNPINYHDLAFTSSGQTMYLSWTGSAVNGLPANPFTLDYTTDLNTWTSVPPTTSASPYFGSLTPGTTSANGSTTYSLPVAANTVFYLRLSVTDLTGQTSYITASILNYAHWTLAGGSTDIGLGGSAASARPRGGWTSNLSTLAYDNSTSRLYYYDSSLDAMTYIDPVTAKWISFKTGVGAFLNGGFEMTIDSNQHALYFVKGGSDFNLYKMDLTTSTISTFMAGTGSCGVAVDSHSNVYACLDGLHISKTPVSSGTPGTPVNVVGNGSSGAVTAGASLSSPLPAIPDSNVDLAVSPNDELYFVDNSSGILWRVRGTDSQLVNVLTFPTHGGGHATIVKPGRIGNELLTLNADSLVQAIDGVTAAATTLVGIAGSYSYSADGTSAATTAISSNSGGAIATNSGQIYFVDGQTGLGNPYVRIRTIDGSGNLQTLAGSVPFSGNGVSLAQTRFPISTTPYFNPFDNKVYITDGIFMKTWNPATDTVTSLFGNGQTGVPSTGSGGTTSPFWFTNFFQFTGSGLMNMVLGYLSNTFTWNGSAYTATSSSSSTNSTLDATTALSPCDGQNILTSCRMDSGAGQGGQSSDLSGNSYFIQSNGTATRIFKADSSGNLTQLMGSNTIAYSPDCHTDGCAKLLPINVNQFRQYISYDITHSRVFFVDFDGANYAFRVITANGRLSTLGTNSYVLDWGGAFDGSRYFYWSQGYGSNQINQFDSSTGTTASFYAPTGLPQSLSVFFTSTGGSPYFLFNGAVYRYDP